MKHRDEIAAVLRTGLAAIPNVGSVLAQAWSEWDGVQKQRRLECAINAVGQQLADLTPTFDPKRITDQHLRFFEEVMRRIELEQRRERLDRLVSLTTSYWSGEVAHYDQAAEFMAAIEYLSEEHLRILLFLESSTGFPSFPEIASNLCPSGPTGDDESRVLCGVNMLASNYGFVRRSWTLGERKPQSRAMLAPWPARVRVQNGRSEWPHPGAGAARRCSSVASSPGGVLMRLA